MFMCALKFCWVHTCEVDILSQLNVTVTQAYNSGKDEQVEYVIYHVRDIFFLY